MKLRLAIPVLAGAVAIAACGGSSSPTTSQTTTVPSAVATSAAFNEADVTFAQSMIPHHEQAIEMAEIALDPDVGATAKVRDLASRIKAGQDPEIDQLTALLQSWSKPIEMDTAGGHDMSSMPGMMSADDMDELAALEGAAFDKEWATMMIAHHEGAIEMAETVKADGSNREILALADKVITAQQGEITELSALAA